MEKSKVNKKTWVTIIIVVILFLLAGGFLLWRQIERMAKRMLDAETVCDQYVETVLTALSKEDLEGIYSLFPEGTNRANIAKGLEELDEIWAGRQTYEYEKKGIQTNVTNGNKTFPCTCRWA